MNAMFYIFAALKGLYWRRKYVWVMVQWVLCQTVIVMTWCNLNLKNNQLFYTDAELINSVWYISFHTVYKNSYPKGVNQNILNNHNSFKAVEWIGLTFGS